MSSGDIPLWAGPVRHFQFYYDRTEDVVVIVPVDDETGEEVSEASVAMDVRRAVTYLSVIEKHLRERIFPLRRMYQNARKRGISDDVVDRRMEGIIVAEDTSRELRRMMRDHH